jgi:hypothetical protein
VSGSDGRARFCRASVATGRGGRHVLRPSLGPPPMDSAGGMCRPNSALTVHITTSDHRGPGESAGWRYGNLLMLRTHLLSTAELAAQGGVPGRFSAAALQENWSGSGRGLRVPREVGRPGPVGPVSGEGPCGASLRAPLSGLLPGDRGADPWASPDGGALPCARSAGCGPVSPLAGRRRRHFSSSDAPPVVHLSGLRVTSLESTVVALAVGSGFSCGGPRPG